MREVGMMPDTKNVAQHSFASPHKFPASSNPTSQISIKTPPSERIIRDDDKQRDHRPIFFTQYSNHIVLKNSLSVLYCVEKEKKV